MDFATVHKRESYAYRWVAQVLILRPGILGAQSVPRRLSSLSLLLLLRKVTSHLECKYLAQLGARTVLYLGVHCG